MLLIGTKRMLGRFTASQMASASVASVLCVFTEGFTKCGAIRRTVCPLLSNGDPSRAGAGTLAEAFVDEAASSVLASSTAYPHGERRLHLGQRRGPAIDSVADFAVRHGTAYAHVHGASR